jgi:hypothetical protein
MRALRKTIARSLLAGSVVVIALVVFAGGAAVALTASSGPRAQLQDFICQTALDPPARAVSVTAEMRPVTGTQRMELEFVLLSEAPGASSFSAVPGPGLGVWASPPDPTLGQRPGDRWILHHPVADLAAPALYRFSVSFRWIGHGGRVLADATHLSRTCNQPELRPDLYVQSFVAQAIAGHPNIDQYLAVIGNRGGGPAKNFVVQFSDGAKVVTRTIALLGKGSTSTLAFQGPLCVTSAAPTLVLDSTTVVDDSNRANNSARATCPVPTGTTGIAGTHRRR